MPKRPGDELVRVTVNMPRRMKELAVECAGSTGMSFSQFVNQAVAQRVRRWEDPITGRAVVEQKREKDAGAPYEGWMCSHGGHGGGAVTAAACVKMGAPDHHRRNSWYWHDDPLRLWKEGEV